MLSIIHEIPAGFLEVPATEIHQILDGPTLIHLQGVIEQPLFVAALLHGNEDVGLLAVQQLLREYQHKDLPRSLSVFIGNVSAAQCNVRRLPGQPDYNRTWPGTELDDTPEKEMMARVVDEMRVRKPFVSVDLHNNTGVNPQYACINRLENSFFQLATLFSRIVVYFLRPVGVQSMAFAELCPSVTLECGKVGDTLGVSHAAEYLHACLKMHALPEHAVMPEDIDLFHTVATLKVPEGVTFSHGESSTDICFVEDIDKLNFCELPSGTRLATVKSSDHASLYAWDESGRDVTSEFLGFSANEIRLSRPAMPAMFTANDAVIRQDCLGYLMERYRLPKSE